MLHVRYFSLLFPLYSTLCAYIDSGIKLSQCYFILFHLMIIIIFFNIQETALGLRISVNHHIQITTVVMESLPVRMACHN